jgi:uncharacterized membrane protein
VKLLVYIFGTQRKIRRAGFVNAMVMGVAIMVFGAPPILLVIVGYAGAGLIAYTQGWMRRHPEG